MFFNIILPWIFLLITLIICFIPSSKLKRNLILFFLGFQILFCIIAISIFASNIASFDSNNSIIYYSSIVGIVVSILFIFISIWRRWSIAKETIFGN
ncbi:hypothetical protein [Mycoplasmoides pirum]|uniref:hypothetical protein n=1 Tax=Mycoplasmoides pirum TaxID=2122 RepID=UPI000485580F|nr:hypothetical protein [Mycoplasmoides pirum]